MSWMQKLPVETDDAAQFLRDYLHSCQHERDDGQLPGLGDLPSARDERQRDGSRGEDDCSHNGRAAGDVHGHRRRGANRNREQRQAREIEPRERDQAERGGDHREHRNRRFLAERDGGDEREETAGNRRGDSPQRALHRVTRVPPDLAIEILSPSTASNDRGRKMSLLGRHGVKEYWLVDPDRPSIEIYILTGSGLALAQTAAGGEHVRSRLLPALKLAPIDIVPSTTQ